MKRNKQEKIFIKAEISKSKSTIFISLSCWNENEEEFKNKYPYLIKNVCKNFNIKIKQSLYSNFSNTLLNKSQEFVINIEENKPFAWEFPNKNREIELNFVNLQNIEMKNNDCNIFKFDQINEQKIISIYNEKTPNHKFYIIFYSFFKGATKHFIFYEKEDVKFYESQAIPLEKTANFFKFFQKEK